MNHNTKTNLTEAERIDKIRTIIKVSAGADNVNSEMK